MAHKPMKQAVIAPSMLALLYPLDEELPGYTQAQFEEDLVGECEKDIRRALQRRRRLRPGSPSTSPRVGCATWADPRNPWRPARLCCRTSSSSTTGSWSGSPPRSGPRSACTPARAATATRCIAPTCPTVTCCRRCSASTAAYFLIQLASERDKDPVYQLIGEHLQQRRRWRDPDGLHRRDQSAESAGGKPRGSPRRPRERGQLLIPEGATRAPPTTCEFSPFSIDEKPSHGVA